MKEHILVAVLSSATTFALLQSVPTRTRELEVDRLVVRQELIVSDTGQAWERGYEAQEIARGLYARSVGERPGGLWVRSRLIKGEIDDPFDDRFHALERDGTLRRVPGHISWNVWLDGAWRQMAILQGEGLEFSEVPANEWNGGTHPGRLRLQSFRPGHPEPLTDALVGQGMMSIGGGGFGGGGLPAPTDTLQLWGGELRVVPMATPRSVVKVSDDATGPHEYTVVAISASGRRSPPSSLLRTGGFARLAWDSVPGADAYAVIRDGIEINAPTRLEGARKEWKDPRFGQP